jgi:hypothetical protein
MVKANTGSKAEVKIDKSSKGHIIYKVNGKRVPGCSTVAGVLDKPALVGWANKQGLAGIDTTIKVKKLADAGTLAHAMVENYFQKKKTDTDDYGKNIIAAAKVSYAKFLDWQKKNNFIMIESELELTSKKYMVGGTLDLYGILAGKRTLLDIKTAKAVYDGHFTQVAGYCLLLEENNREVDDVRVLRIGRSEEEGFQCVGLSERELILHKAQFLDCLSIYNRNKLIRNLSNSRS